MNNLQGYRKWREKLNFYAFAVTVLGYGDMYSPDTISKPLSISEVVSAWEKTVRLIKIGKASRQLGMVIFVPFCKTLCHFCLFPAVPLLRNSQLDIFTDSLIHEMSFFEKVFREAKFNTLWLVGGTPSILERGHFKKIFRTLHKFFNFCKDTQIAIECSVSSLDYDKLKLFRSLNINRVTIGVQSLNDSVLRANNRLFQDRKRSLQVIRDAKKAGIKVVNVDLMCGMPGDNIRSFQSGVKDILSLRPEMIHINPFIFSQETIFFNKKLIYSKEDVLRRSREAKIGRRLIEQAGYRRADGAFFGFTRLDGAQNQQEVDRMQHSASLIGFGSTVTSHAFSQLHYTNVGFEKQWKEITLPKYSGTNFDIKEEMRWHIIKNMRRPIFRKEFKEIYGRDIVESFCKELRELEKYDLVFIDAERIFFKIKTRQEHVILSKHFYNPQILRKIEKKFKVRFNRNKNYIAEVSQSLDSAV